MGSVQTFPLASELMTSQWFNTDAPISLADLRGKVVVVEAFQMLCPGCVSHSLPQAQQIHDLFPKDEVAVLGLHTVFEHHAAMTPVSLAAFIHENRLSFPIGVDQAGTNAIPKTMEAYALRGTPSLIIIDQIGRLRAKHFGWTTDMQIAYQITKLVHGRDPYLSDEDRMAADTRCDENACLTG